MTHCLAVPLANLIRNTSVLVKCFTHLQPKKPTLISLYFHSQVANNTISKINKTSKMLWLMPGIRITRKSMLSKECQECPIREQPAL